MNINSENNKQIKENINMLQDECQLIQCGSTSKFKNFQKYITLFGFSKNRETRLRIVKLRTKLSKSFRILIRWEPENFEHDQAQFIKEIQKIKYTPSMLIHFKTNTHHEANSIIKVMVILLKICRLKSLNIQTDLSHSTEPSKILSFFNSPSCLRIKNLDSLSFNFKKNYIPESAFSQYFTFKKIQSANLDPDFKYSRIHPKANQKLIKRDLGFYDFLQIYKFMIVSGLSLGINYVVGKDAIEAFRQKIELIGAKLQHLSIGFQHFPNTAFIDILPGLLLQCKQLTSLKLDLQQVLLGQNELALICDSISKLCQLKYMSLKYQQSRTFNEEKIQKQFFQVIDQITELKNLEHLEFVFGEPQLTEKMIKQYLNKLNKLQNLKNLTLQFENINFRDNCTQELYHLLQKLTNLSVLVLNLANNESFTSNGLSKLENAFKNFQNLTQFHLDLKGLKGKYICFQFSSILGHLLTANPKLRELHIDISQWEFYDFKGIGQALVRGGSQEFLRNFAIISKNMAENITKEFFTVFLPFASKLKNLLYIKFDIEGSKAVNNGCLEQMGKYVGRLKKLEEFALLVKFCSQIQGSGVRKLLLDDNNKIYKIFQLQLSFSFSELLSYEDIQEINNELRLKSWK